MEFGNAEIIRETHGFHCPKQLACCKNKNFSGVISSEVNPYYPNWCIKVKCCVCLTMCTQKLANK